MKLKKSKRSYLLLEVIIALILVALFLFPVLTPHTYILKAEQDIIDNMGLSHAANLLYVHTLEELYQNALPFETLTEKESRKIPEAVLLKLKLDRIGKLYDVSYHFEKVRVKPKASKGNYHHYLFRWILHFKEPKNEKEKQFSFLVFLIRDLEEQEEDNAEET